MDKRQEALTKKLLKEKMGRRGLATFDNGFASALAGRMCYRGTGLPPTRDLTAR